MCRLSINTTQNTCESQLYYTFNLLIIKRNSIANTINSTVDILASLSIINAVAIADVEAGLGAVLPDRVLHEPGKHGGKRGVEGAGIDPFGHGLNNRHLEQ
jgi:hypothetical protein